MQFVALCVSIFLGVQSLIVADNSEQWISQDEFANRLPATLSPIAAFTAQTSGECFVYCTMNNCSSVGYSSAYKSCKLYSHPTLAKPLPTLAVDPTGFQHQMYYKKRFCPYGWESDGIAKKCYYMDSTTQLRTAAWQVCEEHLNSEMVTFQTPWQRDYLYQILATKYNAVTKWWTGYALFDSQLWPRPVDEIPGYRAYRGDCPGNEIVDIAISSPQQCALSCDRSYRDQCVGFVFTFASGHCMLKYKMCDYSSNSQGLGSEYWQYHKVHAGRPWPKTVNGDLSGSPTSITTLTDVSLSQCKTYARSVLHAVHVAYYSNTRQCNLHSYTAVSKVNVTNCVSFDKKDIADGWCPFGVRYRDVCLIFIRESGTFMNMQNWCRAQGGKFTRPVDGYRKASYLYAVYSNPFVDWQRWLNFNMSYYSTQFDGLTFANSSYYDLWTWDGGQPSGGADVCGKSWNRYTTTNGTFIRLNDCPCNNTASTTVCELPITQPYPKDCRFTPVGREYMGKQAETITGAQCKQWSSISPYNTVYTAVPNTGTTWRQFPDWYTSHTFCRNPDASVFSQPWCYRQDNGTAEACNIPMCPESDWAPSQTYDAPESPYAAITQTNSQTDSYYWTVESISTQANALCQINMEDWCPYYFRGSCYQLYKIPNSHSEAQAICAQNGWHLASITTRDEQYFIMGLTQNLGNSWFMLISYHIGLYWNTTTNNWAWETGDPFTQTFWSTAQPATTGSGVCGFVWPSQTGGSGWWGSNNCWLKTWFICETELAG